MRANCIICSDLFDEINHISAAKCGHVYHSSCLTMWIGQSKTCPHCRARITMDDIYKLYFNFPAKTELNTSELENEILNLKAELSSKNVELVACRKDKDDTMIFVREAEKRANDLQQTVYKCESEITDLRMRTKSAVKMEAKLLKLEQMYAALENDLEHLNNVKTIVNGTQEDVENILKEYTTRSEAAKQLATYCTCLKRELQKVMESKKKLLELNSKLQKENCAFAAKVKFYEEAMAISNNSINKSPKIAPAKKESLFNSNENNSLTANSVASCSYSSESLDMSPLSVAFNKTKFNMCIKTSSATYKPDSDSQNYVKHTNMISLPTRKETTTSIIRTGYNGLGGHSNFIASSGIKKMRVSKKKY